MPRVMPDFKRKLDGFDFEPRRFLALVTLVAAATLTALTASATPAHAQAQKKPAVAQPNPAQDKEFRAFLESLWPQAQSRKITRTTFNAALGDLTLDSSLAKQTAKQAEFVKPVWSYIAGAVSETRINQGRRKAQEQSALLAEVERRTGVDPYVVLAIWGMETSYGGFTGDKNVFRALATLAFTSERKDFFRDELLTALQILQEGHVKRERMTGSWAGAMGHTQFMPSSFMKFAMDYDGDGHKDIWTNVADALASTGNYLARHGWTAGMTWGYEVVLPPNFDVTPHDPKAVRSFPQWASLGVRRADGVPMPAGGEGALLLPAGRRGPAFVVTSNFRVIRSYNNSAAYMLGVALLSDRIAGAGPLAGRWPTDDKPLSTNQAMDIQRQLQRLGYPVGKIDGRIGEQVQAAIRAYQSRAGIMADGYATHALLEQMIKTR